MEESTANPQNEILKRLLEVEKQAEDLEEEAVRTAENLLGQVRTSLEETRKKRLLEKTADCERQFSETRETLNDAQDTELENFRKSLESLQPDKVRFAQELKAILLRSG